jgi:hypothetical protein
MTATSIAYFKIKKTLGLTHVDAKSSTIDYVFKGRF